ncbi:T9SS type A sorting domain-containing protein [Labilibacter sediminis]|nr:T9SS type A sorting domain-containing protein [Labilibacter sediminis]
MKTNKLIKSLSLGVMMSLIAAVAFAGEGDTPSGNVSIHPYLDTDYSIISVANLADKNAVFSIIDENGTVVFKEWVNKAGIEQKIIDFSNINDGVYTASLKAKGGKEVSKTFIVENHRLAGSAKKALTNDSLKAFFHLSDDILTVSHLHFTDSTFEISIVNSLGTEVFERGYSSNSPFSGKFDVSTLPTGDYTVCIHSGNNKYSYAFAK